jgi:hypothetical protein
VISRYVQWNKAGAPIAPSVLRPGAPCSLTHHVPEAEASPLNTERNTQQQFVKTDTDGEVILDASRGSTLRLPSELTIQEMEISVRSYNCLKAASINTVGELLSWTPERLMKLPHFGQKCLYEITAAVHRLGYLGLSNEAAEEKISTKSSLRQASGSEVILCVVDGRPTLRLPLSLAIRELELSVRSYNCLKAASIETLRELLTWTPERLTAFPNFGRKSMDEITNLLRRFGYSFFGEEAAEEAKNQLPMSEKIAPLACLLQVQELLPNGNLAERFIEHGWHSLANLTIHSVDGLFQLPGMAVEEKAQLEAALRKLSLELPLDLPTWFVCNADALRTAFRAELDQLRCLLRNADAKTDSFRLRLSSQSLNHELSQLIPKSYNEQKRKVVVDFLGLGGNDPLTLDEVGKAQRPSITRERVRQIARPVADALSARGTKLPYLSKAIEVLMHLAPCEVNQAERALLNDGILDGPLKISAILNLAARAKLEHNLLLERDLLLTPETSETLKTAVRAAGKRSSHWGVGKWQEIEPLVPEVLRFSLKALLREVVWLDEEQQYFVLPDRENTAANRLARILAITPRLKLADAYRGIFRDIRVEMDRLPQELFAAFCRVWPWCTVEDDEVAARPGLPSAEVSGDDLLVLLLREIGRPVKRRELTKRAMNQGISLQVITHALSYSNVITSANGFFAVIGDPQLDEYSNRALSDAMQLMEPEDEPDVVELALDKSAWECDDACLVPDESEPNFVARLVLAVTNRVETLALAAPWSVSELRLNQRDRDRLLVWGKTAQWDFRSDQSIYLIEGGEKVRQRTALGLAILLFASEAVRRFGDSGSVWPAIERSMAEIQRKLFMVGPGLPKLAVREAVEDACRTFGVRHGFEDVGQQVWLRTLGLQSGLLCSQLTRLEAMLLEPPYSQPVAIQLLLDEEGVNRSASFQASWKLLQDVRIGVLCDKDALERFRSDPWLMSFPPEDLLAHCSISGQLPMPEIRFAATSAIPTEEAYEYFSYPVLRWASDEAYLEYSLNEIAPPWRESDSLILFCEDPYRRERVRIDNDRWQLSDGPVRIPLTQRNETGFCFKLMQGKDEIFADWEHTGLSNETPFTFFRASGLMVLSPDDVPQNEDLVLLHRTDVLLTGLENSAMFRLVLRGMYRLTRLPSGAVRHIQLIGPNERILWRLPLAEEIATEKPEAPLLIQEGKWGTVVGVSVPELPFTAEYLRLNNGEVLPINRSNSTASVRLSPGLGRAQIGRLVGRSATQIRSARVKLTHLGTDFGAALEMDGTWQPLDGSTILDAATLRTHRLLAKVKGSLSGDKNLCWMEGARTLAGLRGMGTVLTGMHGLGESLNVVRGTYNGSQIEVPAAHAVSDRGFWRSVKLEPDGRWSAHLPFEEPLEGVHSLWIWTADSPFPFKLPHSRIEKNGFRLQWRWDQTKTVFGWAFSFSGARIGSIIQPEALGALMQHLNDACWSDAAMWLRWWHVPVLQAEVRDIVARRVRENPLQTLKAWLLPIPFSSELVFDELRDEAWATAARELLWRWRPDPSQAAELAKALGIFTGTIEHDSQQPPSRQSVGLLSRMSPILLVDVVKQALPALYEYPKPQLAVLVGMVLQAINPNAVESGFRLDELCERYARAESRLDGRFILTALVGAAQALLRGKPQDNYNLRIALHQPGLRELICTALMRDLFESWRQNVED